MKKNIKKLLVGVTAGALAVCTCVALAGCASGGSASTSASSSASASASTSASASGSAASYKLLNDGKLTVATSPDFMPWEGLDGDKYVGFDMELSEAVADKLGLEFNPVTLDFDSIVGAIAAGGQADVGCSGFTVDSDRAKQIDFTDSYYTDSMAVVAKDGEGFTADNAKESVNKEGVVIAVQSGTTGESYAKENYSKATIKPFKNANDTFAAVLSGQADIVCTNYSVAGDAIASGSYPGLKIIASDPTDEQYAMIVSKDNPELTKAINSALKELQDDGTIDKLTKKYFPDEN